MYINSLLQSSINWLLLSLHRIAKLDITYILATVILFANESFMFEKPDHLVCDWEDCLKSFADKATLRKHIFNIHITEQSKLMKVSEKK